MEPRTPEAFHPCHDVPHLIRTDQMALATQMVLCQTDQDSWRHLRCLVARAQAFSAQHVVSVLLLVGASACLASWLIG